MSVLVSMLEDAVLGVPPYISRAVQVYAIAEGDVFTMNNFGFLIMTGVHGLENEISPSVALVNLANEAGYVTATYKVRGGAQGGERDMSRAAALHEQVMDCEDGDELGGPVRLLENGIDSLPRDALRTKEVYERAVEGGDLCCWCKRS
ncbi:unnamed protein product [Chondrus crispus]|uniref:Uncharacterized protein n=1 Tax=Chondrus crispus TaxID=2769 RepID=R7Q6N7_CHOCR|nr:unnamed protein product [Chondrus crispus]CDF33031.1 unnamed protein product [Chondrus crispus]|eukprot:XP_005712834.1 unnamed protein product [Chondrus crispus]